VFYKLYLFVDLYSRKIVGWDVLNYESDAEAARVLSQAMESENIVGSALRVHSDNGLPMRGVTMLTTMIGLGVRPSFSRPCVKNDNPFVESLFKTMKYAPLYPTKPFTSLETAKKWVAEFVEWYNSRRHSKLNYTTPLQRHRGEDKAILGNRRIVYQNACAKNPIRWTRSPKAWETPDLAALNPYGTRILRKTTPLLT
jgi:putative transposase